MHYNKNTKYASVRNGAIFITNNDFQYLHLGNHSFATTTSKIHLTSDTSRHQAAHYAACCFSHILAANYPQIAHLKIKKVVIL